MKKSLLFLVCFAFAEVFAIHAQNREPLTNGLPQNKVLLKEFSKPVDSIWTYTYSYKKDTLVLQEKKLQTFTKKGQLLKTVVSFPYKNVWKDHEYHMLYENDILVATSRGNIHKEAVSNRILKNDASGNIIEIDTNKYTYDSKNRLVKVVKDEIMSIETIIYTYTKSGHLDTATSTVTGKMSQSVIGTKRVKYYSNKPYAMVDSKDMKVTYFDTKLGTITKTITDFEAAWKVITNHIVTALAARAMIYDPYDRFVKDYTTVQIENQTMTCCGLPWTGMQYLYGAKLEQPMGDYIFRQIFFSDGTKVGNLNPDYNFIKSLSKTFKTNPK